MMRAASWNSSRAAKKSYTRQSPFEWQNRQVTRERNLDRTCFSNAFNFPATPGTRRTSGFICHDLLFSLDFIESRILMTLTASQQSKIQVEDLTRIAQRKPGRFLSPVCPRLNISLAAPSPGSWDYTKATIQFFAGFNGADDEW